MFIGNSCGQFKIIRKIAEGGQAVVYLAQTKNSTPHSPQFVLKMFNSYKDCRRERITINHLQKNNILPLHENLPYIVDIASENTHGTNDKKILVMPYYNNGNTTNFSYGLYGKSLYNNCIKTEHMLASIWKTINYAHDNNIIHMDIKPDNILLDKIYMENGKSCTIPKLIDWGLAIDNDYTFRKLGTLKYISPEVLNEKHCNKKSDVWSMGITWYSIITCDHDVRNIIEHRNIRDHGWRYIRDNKDSSWWNLSRQSRVILEASLVPDINDRATAREIVELFA